MVLFYSCNASVVVVGWWVTRAGACACTCLQVLGAAPQTPTFCEQSQGLPGCLMGH